MTGVMMVYVVGNRVHAEAATASLRCIGYSRSRGCFLAMDTDSGEIHSADTGARIGRRADPPPPMPEFAREGGEAWIEWGRACFQAAGLRAADRLCESDEHASAA